MAVGPGGEGDPVRVRLGVACVATRMCMRPCAVVQSCGATYYQDELRWCKHWLMLLSTSVIGDLLAFIDSSIVVRRYLTVLKLVDPPLLLTSQGESWLNCVC